MVNDNNGLKMKYFSIRKLNRTNLEKKRRNLSFIFCSKFKKKKKSEFFSSLLSLLSPFKFLLL